jgi:hypothetical protein
MTECKILVVGQTTGGRCLSIKFAQISSQMVEFFENIDNQMELFVRHIDRSQQLTLALEELVKIEMNRSDSLIMTIGCDNSQEQIKDEQTETQRKFENKGKTREYRKNTKILLKRGNLNRPPLKNSPHSRKPKLYR